MFKPCPKDVMIVKQDELKEALQYSSAQKSPFNKLNSTTTSNLGSILENFFAFKGTLEKKERRESGVQNRHTVNVCLVQIWRMGLVPGKWTLVRRTRSAFRSASVAVAGLDLPARPPVVIAKCVEEFECWWKNKQPPSEYLLSSIESS